MGESDLDECFGGIKTQVGGRLQSAFVTRLGKMETGMQKSFAALNRKHNVHGLLEQIEAEADVSRTSGSRARNGAGYSEYELAFEQGMDLARQKEATKLAAAIQELEAELTRVREQARRLRGQTENEKQAMMDECEKYAVAMTNGGRERNGSS